ncbi:filament-like plant protein 2 [Phragmites australis]|uniref:filament-like plant protein 2 n=1 Tax=Phragmites australis TaxID=29695 RepID=UPI002D781A01|nr:filament-like plant protein 2 [Phragmites australis]
MKGASGCMGGGCDKGGAARPPSGSPSASAERACTGPSPRPPSGLAPEPLLEVLESARQVIGRLEVAVVAKRAELKKECAALVDERGRLEEARKLLETRIASACTSYEKSMREVAEERETLEEAHDEAVAAQEKASRMERLMAERDQASRKRATVLLARERQNDELERDRADVLRWEEQVVLRETDVKIMALALDAREEQIKRREADAGSASSALTAQEELVAKREADLAAQEQVVKARAEQLERAQTEAAVQRREIPFTRGVPTSAADGTSLKDRLKNTEDELEIVLTERTNVKLMMQDILQQARDSVEATGLGRVFVGDQSLDKESISHIALGFSEIPRHLEALPDAMQELVTREGRALAQGVAKHVLACYCSRDPAFLLELARQGVVEAEEAAAWEVIRAVTTEVAKCFVREPDPSNDSSSDACSPPPEPVDS